MNTEMTYDVAVVGASIAGCTAAMLLAREGASVALIERHPDPNAYKALCTHFIQPSAVPTIERLGFAPLVEEAGAVPNDIDMWTLWGWIRAPRGIPHGYNIRREVLDPMLRRLAAETPGVDRDPRVLKTASARAEAAGPTNVSFVAEDFRETVLPHGRFDAVVGRLVLLYVPEPAEALRDLEGASHGQLRPLRS